MDSEKENNILLERKKNICEFTYEEIKEFTEEEIIKLINNKYDPLSPEFMDDHPLVAIHDGYRVYYNNKDWNCDLCGNIIKYKQGYWKLKKTLPFDGGTKLCHMCFLKYLILVEENPILRILLEKIYEEESMDYKIALDKLSMEM